ncbi:YihY/virulence factor BrkB family protein [Allosphingosinicella sp.]|jgi:membrane protein|uniref:YihY/virulence factor BrkB family protein n=1 Tax=Allosphingosinicella sp. TaxID=2823234 RepID=UPI002F1F9537
MGRQGASAPAEGKSTPADVPPRAWRDVLLATWREASDDNLELVAAGVAFYAFLAFVPLLTAFVLSYGLVAEPASVVQHMQALTSVMPKNAAEIIGEQLLAMTQGEGTAKGFGLLVALIIALYGATKGATSVIAALNIAYDVKEERGFVSRMAMAFAMTAGAVVTLFLGIIAISAMNFVEQLLPGISGGTHIALKILFWGLAAAAVLLLLAVVYRYGPNRPDADWRWVTPGSAFATVAWLSATAGFGFYVSNFGSYNATYGSLGAVIVFLTWLYLTAYIVLLGAELNSELENEAGVKPGTKAKK